MSPFVNDSLDTRLVDSPNASHADFRFDDQVVELTDRRSSLILDRTRYIGLQAALL